MKYVFGLLVCWVTVFSIVVGHGMAAGAGSSELAGSLVKQLAEQRTLKGVTIQVAPGNFKDQIFDVPLVYSTILAESLTAALSENGSKVSEREQGENPYILLGSYLVHQDVVEITLRLRRMGMEFSTDVATARGTLHIANCDPSWFAVGLEQVAASLVTQVEQQYIRQGSPDVRLQAPVPGIKGQPTRKLGNSLKKELELTLSHAKKLRASFLTSHPTIYTLQPTYSILDDQVSYHLNLINQKGKVIAAGSVVRNISEIMPELLEQSAEEDITVCLEYKKKKARDVSSDSKSVEMLLGYVEQLFTDGNIEVILCENTGEEMMRVSTSLALKAKSLRDDYGVVSATVAISVLDGQNTRIGRLTSTQNAPYSGDPQEGVEKAIHKIFNPKFQNKLTAIILSR
ncbi:MAG: hypothetical protein OEM02_01305 [Desulfobulbaceae bacterium]|nr:hypothetical protein [Desulfobulbaceae bacterium]